MKKWIAFSFIIGMVFMMNISECNAQCIRRRPVKTSIVLVPAPAPNVVVVYANPVHPGKVRVHRRHCHPARFRRF